MSSRPTAAIRMAYARLHAPGSAGPAAIVPHRRASQPGDGWERRTVWKHGCVLDDVVPTPSGADPPERPARHRPPGFQPRRAGAHPARLHAGHRGGRRRPRVRRAADRRLAPRLRPRPPGQPHLQRTRHRLDAGARRARGPRLGLVEGRPPRRPRAARPRPQPAAHPAQPADHRPGVRAPHRPGHRDQAPHPLRRAGRAPAGPGAGRVRPRRTASPRTSTGCG